MYKFVLDSEHSQWPKDTSQRGMRTADGWDTPCVCMYVCVPVIFPWRLSTRIGFSLCWDERQGSDCEQDTSVMAPGASPETRLKLFLLCYVLIERTFINRKFYRILLGDAITNQIIGTCITHGDGKLRRGT
jgi:hypothetical protein